jgi:transposase
MGLAQAEEVLVQSEAQVEARELKNISKKGVSKDTATYKEEQANKAPSACAQKQINKKAAAKTGKRLEEPWKPSRQRLHGQQRRQKGRPISLPNSR